jgi:hypothetical protein
VAASLVAASVVAASLVAASDVAGASDDAGAADEAGASADDAAELDELSSSESPHAARSTARLVMLAAPATNLRRFRLRDTSPSIPSACSGLSGRSGLVIRSSSLVEPRRSAPGSLPVQPSPKPENQLF